MKAMGHGGFQGPGRGCKGGVGLVAAGWEEKGGRVEG